MRLSEALDLYQRKGRYKMGHSAATYYVYSGRMKQFQGWLSREGYGDPPVREVTTDLLEVYYISQVVESGVRPRTQRSHIHAFRAFWQFLIAMKLAEVNPAQLLEMPDLDPPRITWVSGSELERLVDAAGRQATSRLEGKRCDFRSIRDQAVIGTLVYTAIRRQELLDLAVTDVNLSEMPGTLIVQKGKGNKQRTVPLCQEVSQLLAAWLELRRTLRTKTEKLFTIPGGRPLGDDALRRLLEEVEALAGYKETHRFLPHVIRRSAATRLHRKGVDLRNMQTWLGHTEIRTTEKYLKADEESIREVAHLMNFKEPEVKEAPVPVLPVKPSRVREDCQRRRRTPARP